MLWEAVQSGDTHLSGFQFPSCSPPYPPPSFPQFLDISSWSVKPSSFSGTSTCTTFSCFFFVSFRSPRQNLSLSIFLILCMKNRQSEQQGNRAAYTAGPSTTTSIATTAASTASAAFSPDRRLLGAAQQRRPTSDVSSERSPGNSGRRRRRRRASLFLVPSSPTDFLGFHTFRPLLLSLCLIRPLTLASPSIGLSFESVSYYWLAVAWEQLQCACDFPLFWHHLPCPSARSLCFGPPSLLLLESTEAIRWRAGCFRRTFSL